MMSPISKRVVAKAAEFRIRHSCAAKAKLWDANTGQCTHTLKGHQTEIVCVAFNLQEFLRRFWASPPMWQCLGHSSCHWQHGQHRKTVGCRDRPTGLPLEKSAEPEGPEPPSVWLVVSIGVDFGVTSLHNLEVARDVASLEGHTAEIVSLNFNTDGDKILTGSFDNTAKVQQAAEYTEALLMWPLMPL
eukprot:3589841-Amphidinium_carterae.1